MQTVQDISEKIKSDWKPPSPAALHWDGKLLETLGDKYKISGVGGVKLLGVPALPTKSSESAGNLIANSTIALLESWKCDKNVSAMVFDTTSANTGKYATCYFPYWKYFTCVETYI